MYQFNSAPDWQYGYQEVVQFIADRNHPAEPVQVTRTYGRPSMYFLYYLHYDPLKIQQEAKTAPKDQGELLAFGPYTFGSIAMSKPGLAVSEAPLSSGTLVKTVSFPNNKPAFYIYELK